MTDGGPNDRDTLDEVPAEPAFSPAAGEPPAVEPAAVEPAAAEPPASDPWRWTPGSATAIGAVVASPHTGPDASVSSSIDPAGGSPGEPLGAATTPPGADPGMRRGLLLLATAALVGVAAIAVLFATGFFGSRPEASAYLPSNSLMVMELRSDLTDDERSKFEVLLGSLPEFASVPAGERMDRLNERVLDMLDMADAGNFLPGADLDGPMFVAYTSVPTQDQSFETVVAAARVKGSATCGSYPGATSTSTETYTGHELTLYQVPALGRIACTVNGSIVLYGGVDLVKAALDRNGVGGMAENEVFASAEVAIPDDRLGWAFIDGPEFVRAMKRDPVSGASLAGLNAADFPAWFAMSYRLGDSAVIVDVVVPTAPTAASGSSSSPSTSPAGSAGPSNRPAHLSSLAGRLPATTVLAVEAHDLGPGLVAALARLKDDRQMAEAASQIEQGLGFFGGTSAVLGWMGDAVVVVTRDGSTWDGGLVIEAVDESRANATITQLNSLLQLAGTDGMTVTTTPFGTGEITLLDAGPLAPLIEATQGALPEGFPPDARLTVGWSVQSGLFVVGASADFVKAVLGATPGSTLADRPAYMKAVTAAGPENDGQLYLDINALRETVESLVPAADQGEYDQVRPYVKAIRSLAMSVRSTGALVEMHLVVTLGEGTR